MCVVIHLTAQTSDDYVEWGDQDLKHIYRLYK